VIGVIRGSRTLRPPPQAGLGPLWRHPFLGFLPGRGRKDAAQGPTPGEEGPNDGMLEHGNVGGGAPRLPRYSTIPLLQSSLSGPSSEATRTPNLEDRRPMTALSSVPALAPKLEALLSLKQGRSRRPPGFVAPRAVAVTVHARSHRLYRFLCGVVWAWIFRITLCRLFSYLLQWPLAKGIAPKCVWSCVAGRARHVSPRGPRPLRSLCRSRQLPGICCRGANIL